MKIETIESHTGGEPFRIVTGGLPEIPGETILEKRSFAQANLDDLRKSLMWEPRGHADMYGAWLTPAVADDSDLGVLFLHNDGFSTMCGHGIIALTQVALVTEMIPRVSPVTTMRIDTPAGQVTAMARVDGDTVEEISFRNVPSFVESLDNRIDVPGIGAVAYDIAFGGAYYAYIKAENLGLNWPPEQGGPLVDLGRQLKAAISDSHPLTHPVEPDLGFLYGVVIYGPPVDSANTYRNVCVFADGEIDRSPTGTGVSGHVALGRARGSFDLGDEIAVESIVGSRFVGSAVEDVVFAGVEAVVPQISGSAHITGRSTFWIDPADPLNPGFLLR